MPDRALGKRWKLAARAILVVVGLTVLFAADDWLLILLAEQLRLGPFPKLAYVGAGLVVGGTNVLLAVAVYRVMRRKPASGAEALVGETAVALRDFRGTGPVRLHGETWMAEVEGRVKKGDRLVVQAVEGLRVRARVLRTERGPGGQADSSAGHK